MPDVKGAGAATVEALERATGRILEAIEEGEVDRVLDLVAARGEVVDALRSRHERDPIDPESARRILDGDKALAVGVGELLATMRGRLGLVRRIRRAVAGYARSAE